jgi:hypothetical protein
MKWVEVKKYDELWEYMRDSWTVVATVTVDDKIYNIAVYRPKDSHIKSRTGRGYRVGAKTLVLKIPDPLILF